MSRHAGDDRMMGIGGEAIASALYALAGVGVVPDRRRDAGRGGALLPRAPPGRGRARGGRDAAAARLGRGAASPAVRGQRLLVARSGRHPGRVAGRPVRRLHRQPGRRAGGDHDGGRGAVDDHRREHARGRGGAGVGVPARRPRRRRRRGRVLARGARGVPREGRPRRSAPPPRARKRKSTTSMPTASATRSRFTPSRRTRSTRPRPRPTSSRRAGARPWSWRRSRSRWPRRRAKGSASARRAAWCPRRSSIRSAPRWRRSSPRSRPSSASRPNRRTEEATAVDAKAEDLPAIGAQPLAPPPPVDAPIIVEPASIARFRQQEAADAAAAAELSAEEAARLRDEKRGFIKLGDADFQLPGTDLLEYIPPANQQTEKQPLYDMAERLEQAMSNYGVRGKVKEIHMGPVVTMFEFAPAPGTRTGKIAEPREGSGDGAGGAGRPHRRADPRQGGGRRRGAEQVARDGLPEGDPPGHELRDRDVEAADRAGQGHQGRARQREPVQDAPPAGRRAPPARASRSPSTA